MSVTRSRILTEPKTVASPRCLVYARRSTLNRLRRAFDVTGALVALVIVAPFLALAALAILIEDGRPIIFAQRRVGQFERLFTMYKLRTMRKAECGDAFSPTAAGDRRITSVGRVLRKLSIDELPQLVNVVRGDMSLVGPRPEMPFVVRQYEPWQHLRHLVRPGLTCLWQIRLRSLVPLHKPEATKLDIEYIESASPRVDASILAMTVLAILRPKGAF